MLILTRKPGESLYIGDGIKITIVEIKGHQIRVGIDAPKDMRIYREEIWEQIKLENQQAAASGLDGLGDLDKWQGGRASKPNPLASGASVKQTDAAKVGTSPALTKNLESAQVVVRRKKKMSEHE